MTNFNYSLELDNYTWTNALLWGNCIGHFKKASEGSLGNRVVHIIIAIIELLPIISQIASIFEKLIVVGCKTPKKPSNNLQNQQHNQQSRYEIRDQTPLNQWTQDDVRSFHQQFASLPIAQSSLIEWSQWSYSNIMPSMEGLAKISTFLMNKHQLPQNSLLVCHSLQHFKDELDRIQKNINVADFRCAFIVGTHSTSWGKNKAGTVPKRTAEFASHILAVALEKRGNELHIALLDPMIHHGNEKIKPNHIGLTEEFEKISFTEQELVLSYIMNAGLNPDTTTLYHSSVWREKSNGCWVFALKDAIAFLKSSNFFSAEITQSKIDLMVHSFKLKKIDTLPISFITTAQFSPQDFENYFKAHPEQDTKKTREKIAKHQVQNQNQRIGHAMVKWLKILSS